jgi:hypothetical protein
MTTRAIVPNGDGEGSLGTSTAKWGAVYSSDPVSGENSGQVPTTAWVQKLLADALAKQKAAYEQAISTAVSAAQTKAKLDAHPVGSYYFSDKSTSPADLFGGTWEALPAGYTLIAQGSGTDDYGSFTYTAGQKYGERKHQLTTDELPHIRGDVLDFARQTPNQKLTTHGVFSAPASIENVSFGSNTQSGQGDGFIMDFGKDVPHNNLSPCVAAYGWRRTA